MSEAYIRACVLAQRAWEHKQDHGTQPNAEQGRQIVAEVDQMLAARYREVKAEALREAAGDAHPFYPTGGHVTVTRGGLRQWLSDRADRIESEARP